MSSNTQNEYRANDADSLVGELFSGKIDVAEAIERLRTRLLDLSSRNPLLNYRHPKRRCVQIVDNPNINLVFARLYGDGKSVPIKYVPEPSLKTYEGKRLDVRVHAPSIGISIESEFPPNGASSQGHRLHGIQALFYPEDLERQLRKIASEARTAIEETGTNMLFLIFGFLEFYDSEDSDRPLLAPILSLPVSLSRGGIDQETRTYMYSIGHNGEDLAENYTLREKLRRDFMLNLPEFEEDDEPEAYFSRIEQSIKNKRRWRVRRQVTAGMLSFGKLAIWADLDTKKNSGLVNHELIKSVFSGGSGGGAAVFHAEDYQIDQQPDPAQPLIFDADSSQHSAIIDVLAGKNLVINGPPGTGKSQTITNIIAAALCKGKKVLFVSEKLAALEVVRRRLNQAGLGHFCLELHSHKTQKKRFLEDIQARIDQTFAAPLHLQDKLTTLKRHKGQLARYAELMGSRIGNALGLTVNEVFWAAERRRQELGDLAAAVNSIKLPDSPQWTFDDIELSRSRLVSLAELYESIGGFDTEHPWWGFVPNLLAPADDESIDQIISRALEYARSADDAANELVEFFGLREQPDAASVNKIRAKLTLVPAVSDTVDASLLSKMFDPVSDPNGQSSAQLLSGLSYGITRARNLSDSAAQVLADGQQLPLDIARATEAQGRARLTSSLLTCELRTAFERITGLENAAVSLSAISLNASPQYSPQKRREVAPFLANWSKDSISGLGSFPIHILAMRSASLLAATHDLSDALIRVEAIAERRSLPFDSSVAAVKQLADSGVLPGLNKDIHPDAQILAEARRLGALPLNDRPIREIEQLAVELDREIATFDNGIAQCKTGADLAGLSFDGTDRSIAETVAVVKVAAGSPSDLLEYRRSTFGQARTSELIDKIRAFLIYESGARTSLGELFYLDALPSTSEIKLAIRALRQKSGLFAFFDSEWRSGRKFHASLSKEKRKLKGKRRAEELASLVAWLESKDAFTRDTELNECFGSMFRGLETDLDKISRLNDWYLSSRATLAECPGLMHKVDLTNMASNRIAELAAKATDMHTAAKRLSDCKSIVLGILSEDVAGFQEAKSNNWDEGLQCLRNMVKSLKLESGYFAGYVAKDLSPKDAVRLLEARADLDEAASDIAFLLRGEVIVHEAGGTELGTLIEIGSGSWNEALPEISAFASLMVEATAKAKSFAAAELPLSTAVAFAKAMIELDVAWSEVAPPPDWNQFDTWQTLVAAAEGDAQLGRRILETIAPCARDDASADKIFKAFSQEAEAQGILEKLSKSAQVQKMLGEHFDGANTDLHCLLETHAWGCAVCHQELPPAMRRILLDADARHAFQTARRLSEAIDVGCCKVKELVEEFKSFGSFNWSEWQRHVRSAPGRDLPSEIRSRLEIAASTRGTVLPWSKYISLRGQCLDSEVGTFVSAMESEKIPSRALASAFELATYQSIGRSIYQAHPELAHFNGASHDKTQLEYRALDAEIISLNGKDFGSQIERRTHVPQGQRGAAVGDYTNMHLLRREISKQRRHIPIRQLVKRAGRALQELKPCWMMGPLSVAQYLEQGPLKFDLVVMDEASQLRPEEALGAIARGTQLVVVGDPKQLPPTNFFDRMLDSADEEESDAPAAISGMESILDICQQLFAPVRSLRWHYRSHHESLIAFSNHHFYKNLIVFPSPYSKNPGLGVKYRYVKNGLYKDRQNIPEAQRVVDAVVEHMLKRPDESLGVVTLNQTQRERIEEMLDKKLKSFEESADFISRWDAEGWPFFVKNLENVQGDERDVIFISTTFGLAAGTDKVRQNFGPISRPDGWRRLNVLFTRARRRVRTFYLDGAGEHYRRR